jgi:hypothetical protein
MYPVCAIIVIKRHNGRVLGVQAPQLNVYVDVVDAARRSWTSSASHTTAPSDCCARFALAGRGRRRRAAAREREPVRQHTLSVNSLSHRFLATLGKIHPPTTHCVGVPPTY